MKYFIKYGRGDFIEFKTLKEAKQWQRDNILPDYENDQFGIGEDEINNYAWGCKWVKEDDGVWLFTLLNGKGQVLDVDTSDGAGWYIERIED